MVYTMNVTKSNVTIFRKCKINAKMRQTEEDQMKKKMLWRIWMRKARWILVRLVLRATERFDIVMHFSNQETQTVKSF